MRISLSKNADMLARGSEPRISAERDADRLIWTRFNVCLSSIDGTQCQQHTPLRIGDTRQPGDVHAGLAQSRPQRAG
jgi:hypothetical protein